MFPAPVQPGRATVGWLALSVIQGHSPWGAAPSKHTGQQVLVLVPSCHYGILWCAVDTLEQCGQCGVL